MSRKTTEEKTVESTAQGAAVREAEGSNVQNKSAVPEDEQCVYIGPTIRGTITKNTIYANGIPKSAQEKIEKYPILKRLFVPVKDLPEVNRSVQAGGKYKVLYEKAIKELSKEV